jgi:hypothetical protein
VWRLASPPFRGELDFVRFGECLAEQLMEAAVGARCELFEELDVELPVAEFLADGQDARAPQAPIEARFEGLRIEGTQHASECGFERRTGGKLVRADFLERIGDGLRACHPAGLRRWSQQTKRIVRIHRVMQGVRIRTRQLRGSKAKVVSDLRPRLTFVDETLEH